MHPADNNQRDFWSLLPLITVAVAFICFLAWAFWSHSLWTDYKNDRMASHASTAATQAPDTSKGPDTAAAEDAGAKSADKASSDEETAVADAGEALYKDTCFSCHDAGTAGAPKLGNEEDWAPRLAEGMDALMDVALNGRGAMPPRGGAADASDDDIRDTVLYMVQNVDPDKYEEFSSED